MGNQFSGNFTGKKRRSRQRDLLIAIALGGVMFSLLVVLVVLFNLKKVQPPAASPQGAELEVRESGPITVTLIAPTQTITRGDRLGDYSFQEVLWPADAVPIAAIDSTEGISELFAKVDLPSGQPIQATSLTKEEPPSTIKITPGMRAVTITVNAQSGLEGWASPGTRVDVVLTYTTAGNLTSKVIVQNARVLSFAGSADLEQKSPTGRRLTRRLQGNNTITLEVSPGDALKVQTSRQLGTLTLLMRAPEDDKAPSVMEFSKETIEGVKPAEAPPTKQCIRGTMRIAGQEYTIDCDGSILNPVE